MWTRDHLLGVGHDKTYAVLEEGATAALASLATGVAQAADAPVLNSGDTAFLVVCSLVVLLMTLPGLALFYGGLARSKTCCRC